MPHAQNFRPVSVTRKPQGAAAATICAGQQHNMQWFCFLHVCGKHVVPHRLMHNILLLMVPPSVFVSMHVHSLLLCCSPERSHQAKKKMCVSFMWDHSPKALAAGDELCISYEYNYDPIPKMARRFRV